MQGTIEQRIAEKFAHLNREQRAAVHRHMQGQGISLAQIPIVPCRREGSPPLSYAQARQWFLWNLDPASTAYHISGALRLDGELDVEAVRACFGVLSARHEALRTVFRETENGEAWQEVLPVLAPEFRQIELPAHAPEQGDAVVRAAAEAFANQVFDLRHGPLLRVGLIREAGGRHVLVLSMHHIVSDGWSLTVLTREFSELYRQARAGGTAGLAPLPIQYSDYALWQRSWLEAGERERQLAYWRAHLGVQQPVLQLHADGVRRNDGLYRAARAQLVLPAQLIQRLHLLAQARGATLFMVLLAGWQVLLHRYSGMSDIRIGIPSANRHRAETVGMLGFFVNTQVLRGELRTEDTLEYVLKQARTAALGAQEHQDLPFEQLVDALQVERVLGQNPLFQVMYNHQRAGEMLDALPGVEVASYELGKQSAQLELVLDTAEQADGTVDAALTYAAELFCGASMARMLRHYETVLRHFANDPSQTLASMPLLDALDLSQLAAWGQSPVHFDAEMAVHRMFEQQAAQRPDAPALVCGSERLTYAELNVRANRLAHHLIALGAGPECKVGIALERGVDMVVALLAVLKSGAAYVPLDPNYPQERLAYVVQDAGIGHLLTHSALLGRIPAGAANVLALDTLAVLDVTGGLGASAGAAAMTMSPGADDNPEVALHADHLAYAIYTSGSTGRPKGVAVRHEALSSFLLSMREAPGITPEDRVLALTSLAFDIAALELYLPLVSGAQILLTAQGAEDILAMAAQASIVQATPSGWRMLLASGWEPASVKGLCGGEALQPDLAAALQQAGVELWNMYGPTETTIWSSVRRLEPGEIALGGPIAGTQLYVLDAALQLAPQGVAGELYIGGVGLARGYMNRAALSAERFVADPFGANGERLYRTGDLVRWRADGQLEYLGRLDHQVKIRGFRIELGEIEVQLLAQPDVAEAVVVAQEGPAGTRLAAYVSLHAVACDAAASDAATAVDSTVAATLRSALSASLPDYMVPAAVMVLARLPQTPNGKVDRKALPSLELAATTFEEAQGELEQELAAIWREVLGISHLGRHDNFFELGGDSILSLQIVARARRAGLMLTARLMFERQSIAGLATALQMQTASQAPRVVALPEPATPDAAPEQISSLGLDPAHVSDAYPLSPMQAGMLFHSVLDVNGGVYLNQLRVDIEGLDAARFRQAWNMVFQRHDVLRTGFLHQRAAPLQWVARSVELPWREHDLRAHRGQADALDALAQAELEPPFALDRPPLVRLALVRTGAASHHFVWTAHHLLTDGWSMSQLMGDVLRAYEGGQLEAPAYRYRDYIFWLLKRDMSASERWWRAQVAQLDAPTRLSGSLPRPRHAGGHGERQLVLDAAAVRALQEHARSERVTVNTLVQAAWALLLARVTGQETVCFGATTSGRPAELAGADRIQGMFINTLPMVCRVDPGAATGAWLRALQAHNVAAREHEYTPLYDIQRWAGQGGQGLFDTLLVYENYPVDEALKHAPHGTSFALRASREQTSYPLTLTVSLAETLVVKAGYDGVLFSAGDVDALLQQWRALLAGFAQQPAIGNVALASAASQAALLELGSSGVHFDASVAVHRMFERQASLRPDAPALTCGGELLTYGELNVRANRLAHRLIALGVGPEHKAGIALERGVDMVVALLAVLKSGAAYVPLDPNYPQERLAYVVQDAGIGHLLTHSALLGRIPAGAANVLAMDTLAVLDVTGGPGASAGAAAMTMSPGADDNPEVALHADHLAYAIYTSGSTGKPKGVAVRHEALSSFLLSMREAPGITPEDRVLALTSLAFDIAALELYLPLVSGAQILLTAQGAEDILAMAAQASIVQATPSGWRMLLASGWEPASVKGLCGGEALQPDLAAILQQAGVELWNMYGPTETTIWSSVRRLEPGEIALGGPIAGTQLYVLDVALQLAPQGVAGELYIGGVGLARGYMSRAALSAERFVADPFGANGERLYRTGDLVRWSAEGQLEYLGRLDHQVKIRGFRIELGEIEAQLLAQPDVAEAVVVAQEGPAGTRLAAYVSLHALACDAAAGDAATAVDSTVAATLRSALSASLPDYMVPAAVMVLARLPQTPNGKVDRKALPPLDCPAPAYEAPQGEAELALADIWCELLGTAQIGRHDNFFELGGHSITVLQMHSRVRQQLGVDAPHRIYFEQATLQTLAAALLQHAQSSADTEQQDLLAMDAMLAALED